MKDLIDRQAVIDVVREWFALVGLNGDICVDGIISLPSTEPEIIRCRECKHFDLDHLEKIHGFPIPIIVAHEICTKWGRGCKTSSDGWCFMAERKEENGGSDQ